MVQARHRMWAWGLIIGGVVAWLFAGGLAHAADPPTATFTAIGSPPNACGSRPDVNGLEVSEGTAVVVANHVGVPAEVVVAGQAVLTIDYGTAALLTLAAGRYEIELVPQCRNIANTHPLTVTVTPASPPPPGSPSSPPPGSSSSPPPGSSSSPPPGSDSADSPPALGPAAPNDPTSGGGVAVGRTDPAATSAPAGPPVPGDPTSPSASTSASPQPAPGPSGVVKAEAIPWTKPPDPKGVRLLAVIAAICVLGVTAAIIRSIVRLDA